MALPHSPGGHTLTQVLLNVPASFDLLSVPAPWGAGSLQSTAVQAGVQLLWHMSCPLRKSCNYSALATP